MLSHALKNPASCAAAHGHGAHWCVTVAMPFVPVVPLADEPSPKLNTRVAPAMGCSESRSSRALYVKVCCVFAATGVLLVNRILASATVTLPQACARTISRKLVSACRQPVCAQAGS